MESWQQGLKKREAELQGDALRSKMLNDPLYNNRPGYINEIFLRLREIEKKVSLIASYVPKPGKACSKQVNVTPMSQANTALWIENINKRFNEVVTIDTSCYSEPTHDKNDHEDRKIMPLTFTHDGIVEEVRYRPSLDGEEAALNGVIAKIEEYLVGKRKMIVWRCYPHTNAFLKDGHLVYCGYARLYAE